MVRPWAVAWRPAMSCGQPSSFVAMPRRAIVTAAPYSVITVEAALREPIVNPTCYHHCCTGVKTHNVGRSLLSYLTVLASYLRPRIFGMIRGTVAE